MKYFSPALLDGSVTTAKIANDAVTIAKMANSSVGQSQILSHSIHQIKLHTTETSLSGSIPLLSSVDIALMPYSFWPMVHVENQSDLRVTGHSTDAPGSDNARLGLRNGSGAFARTYDIDYRHVDA